MKKVGAYGREIGVQEQRARKELKTAAGIRGAVSKKPATNRVGNSRDRAFQASCPYALFAATGNQSTPVLPARGEARRHNLQGCRPGRSARLRRAWQSRLRCAAHHPGADAQHSARELRVCPQQPPQYVRFLAPASRETSAAVASLLPSSDMQTIS